MSNTVRIINELLVELFNDILAIEANSLKSTGLNDLSVTEMHVIEAIGLSPRTMTDVANDLGVTVGTLTTSINRLVKKEYVQRSRSEEDRRFVNIELTRKGKVAYRTHQSFHEGMVRYMIEGLSDEDNEVLVASLQRLSNFFKEKYHLSGKEKKS